MQFNEESRSADSRQPTRTNQKGLTGFLISLGIAKNTKQANVVLIVVLVVLCAVMYFALVSLSDDASPNIENDDTPPIDSSVYP